MTFNIDAYLDRIQLPLQTLDITALTRLQDAQMRAIPFENIDVLLGEIPDLSTEAVWKKLVEARRGGYCFELNKLFEQALVALGFSTRPSLCRVRMGAPTGGPRTHQAVIVSIDGTEWLADAGFGGPGPVAPIRLDNREPQIAGDVTFRLRTDPATGELVLERRNGDQWFSLYGLDGAVALPPDFEAANFICARWDRSPFPTMLMANILIQEGRASLMNRTFRHVRGAETEERTVKTARQLGDLLEGIFGLSLPEDKIENIWAKVSAA